MPHQPGDVPFHSAATHTLSPYPLDPQTFHDGIRRATARRGDTERPLDRLYSALTRWNAYLAHRNESDRAAYLEDMTWLIAHEVTVGSGMGGWPMRVEPSGRTEERSSSGIRVLSAQTQGRALSALQRAYQLTGDEMFRRCATRVFQTFTHDILDGGISTSLGDGSLLFEDVGMYPATHALQGHLIGVLSLYDYYTLSGNADALALARRCHSALPQLLTAYDAQFWVYADLLTNTFATPDSLRRLARMLKAIADYSDCIICRDTAAKWEGYSRSFVARRRVGGKRMRRALSQALWRGVGVAVGLPFGSALRSTSDTRTGICVPVTAYPLAGGMRAVLDGWRSAMASDWNMEFLTAYRGPDVGDRVIFRFAGESQRLRQGIYTPSEFPNVLMYVAMGLMGLRRLVRQRPAYYKVILPQDGIYSAAFAGIIAKLAGIRLVAVDHGNVRDAFDPTYYAEKRELLAQRRRPGRMLSYMRLVAYMRVLRLLARFGTRCADHFLVASDDIARAYQQQLGVPSHRITRFPFMIDGARYAPVDDETRRRLRADFNLPTDAIIVVIISRLHPVKGIDTGIMAVERAYDALPEHLRSRLFLLIAGDGVLREQVAEQVRASRLAGQSHLWGEASADDVAMLLRVSDIFLYPARRGINSMAILEAMGAGCATVATITSPHIAEYLAEDRGIAVAVEDVDALAAGLTALIADDARRHAVGQQARDYVMQHHTATAVRRYLLRATYWVPSIATLDTPTQKRPRI